MERGYPYWLEIVRTIIRQFPSVFFPQGIEYQAADAAWHSHDPVEGIHQILQPYLTRSTKMIDIYDLHQKMTAHLFPAYSSTDERFLALALCGEAGELANMIKKRWRDNADLTQEICEELADIRIYLELLAKCFNVEGEKLDEEVKKKLKKVAEKHQDLLKANKWINEPKL